MKDETNANREDHSGPVLRLMLYGRPNFITWENGQTEVSSKDVRDELCVNKATARILRHYGGVTDTRLRTVDVLFITARGEIRSTIEYAGQLEDFGTPFGGNNDEFKGNRPILYFAPFET